MPHHASIRYRLKASTVGSAALAWTWLRESARLRTLLASFVALVGIAIIVGNAPRPSDFLGIVLSGFFQVAMGLTLFVLGSRFFTVWAASLTATLETPLMPFWVWLAFGETSTSRELVGGVLVQGAVIVDIIGDTRPLTRWLSTNEGPFDFRIQPPFNPGATSNCDAVPNPSDPEPRDSLQCSIARLVQ